MRPLNQHLPFGKLNWVDDRTYVMAIAFLCEPPVALSLEHAPRITIGDGSSAAAALLQHRLIVSLNATTLVGELPLGLLAQALDLGLQRNPQIPKHTAHEI
ncbi:MAG: hypothetical protein KF689_14315 [Gemmatimonadaceae bacterium]|nr:hypothetical protein [Gemmatimonadaceae bacterium]MCW5826838.1 hypothetical protein [Gemmatimonadaceae bacterium]